MCVQQGRSNEIDHQVFPSRIGVVWFVRLNDAFKVDANYGLTGFVVVAMFGRNFLKLLN